MNLFDTSDTILTNQTLSVSELNRKVKDLLATHFPLLWVEGEISNLGRPASGHWYFTLKDSNAQVSCAMFKNRNAKLGFTPKVGDHVRLRVHVGLYEGRGDYQLIVEHMEQAGFGLLQKRFEELKARLDEEGLFAQENKQPLPSVVKHLAVITSATGAAIQDVLSVLARRYPAMPVTVIPSMVQGDQAAEQLIQATQLADEDPRFDCILLCRGGGSIEDLWSFNHEGLARAIADCETPTVCAVGHEVDFTIADFVADVRAPTPSAAAELISPNIEEMQNTLDGLHIRLIEQTASVLKHARYTLVSLQKRLRHPRDTLAQWHQRLDHIDSRLSRAWHHVSSTSQQRLAFTQHRLRINTPGEKISNTRANLSLIRKQLQTALQHTLKNKQASFRHAMAQLDLVSPIATLNRGYSITKTTDGDIVRHIKDVSPNSDILIQVSDGNIAATVKASRKGDD